MSICIDKLFSDVHRSCIRKHTYLPYCSEPLITSDAEAETEAAALQNVCWLEVIGKLELSHLTPGVTYEVFFEVMVNNPAYGWSKLTSDGTMLQHRENLLAKPGGSGCSSRLGR
jgi:hypothetical protein